jgi:hypothetical protein
MTTTDPVWLIAGASSSPDRALGPERRLIKERAQYDTRLFLEGLGLSLDSFELSDVGDRPGRRNCNRRDCNASANTTLRSRFMVPQPFVRSHRGGKADQRIIRPCVSAESDRCRQAWKLGSRSVVAVLMKPSLTARAVMPLMTSTDDEPPSHLRIAMLMLIPSDRRRKSPRYPSGTASRPTSLAGW